MKPTRPTADIDGYVPFPDERVEEYLEKGYWENQAFHEVLDRTAEAAPETTAIVGKYGERTYGELVENTERIAAYLAGELGLDVYDRVVLQFTNRLEFIELFFACSRIGVLPVMLLPRHREAETRHVLDFSDAKAFVAPDAEHLQYVDRVEGMADEFDDLEHCLAVTAEDRDLPPGWIDYPELLETDWAEFYDGALDVEVNPNDPAFLLLSGGTTGMPKGIPRTHNDYVLQWRKFIEAMDMGASWTNLSCVPIGHNASLVGVVGPTVYAGATLALEERLKPGPLMQRITETNAEYIFAVPTQLVDMLEHEDLETYDLSSLEVILSGGQKVRPNTVYELVDRYDLGFMNVFGMAEGPVIVTRPDDDVDVQAHTVGRPMVAEADEFRIVDETRSEEVPDGTPGELAGRGASVFRGYFRNPEENRENFDENGWFYTEDVLERGEDGNYRVHGRLKDTIIRGGENIYAPGVEDEIIEHPSVENVAVVGMPDERLGERPMAYLELVNDVEDLSLGELKEYLEDRGLAVFKHPERVEIVEELPRTEVDKIDKVALKDRITDQLKREGELAEEY